MRTIIKLLLLLLLYPCVGYASELGSTTETVMVRDSLKHKKPPGDGASAKGKVVIQPALNFGHHLGFGKLNYGGVNYGSGLVPGVTLNIDANVHDYVSVGVFYSAAFRNYKTADVFYLGNAFGARIAFHWWQFIDDKSDSDLFSDKIDFDVHVHLGGYYVRYKDKTLDTKAAAKGFNAGAGVAIRYYFIPHFGVAIEAGYEESSWAKLGFAIKI
jgi:hypothetical protein